jgi:uncharacterized protein YndB with AHSA1/START domain
MATSLKYVQSVGASPSLVYRAFTNATALREWLCDTASVDPRPGGRFFIAWNNGYYASGEYSKVQPDKEVQFIWQGRDDPGPTKVRMLIEALDNGMCTVTLEHFDLANNHEWASALNQIDHGWKNGLTNLVSTLDAGPDLRIINRPMMGIVFGVFDKKRAAELGTPVSQGMCIDSVVDCMGALDAGLRKNDVIVSIGNKPVFDYPALIASLQNHKAGDLLEVGFYRGSEKKKVKMALSRRKVPEVPMTPAGLAAVVAQNYNNDWAWLGKILEGVSEQEASFRTAPGEWTVKEIIAHLLHGERDIQAYIQDLAASQERVSDGFGKNLDARVLATVEAYETLDCLLDAYKRSRAETVALLNGLPQDFANIKSSFWKLGYQLLLTNSHTREHESQFSLAISAARQ